MRAVIDEISVIRKALLPSLFGLSVAGAGVLAATTAAFGQAAAPAPSAANPLGLPDTVTLLGQADPNVRKATAVVNGQVITGTDVEHRVALLTNASEGELPEAELQRVRMQVLRNLIDETLQIQEAKAQEVEVPSAEVNLSLIHI